MIVIVQPMVKGLYWTVSSPRKPS